MQKVIFPLQQNDTGSDVVNLQDVLLLLLERAVIRPQSQLQLAEWQRKLKSEKETQTYGSTTFELVRQFQRRLRILTGTVNSSTAAAMNALLEEWGVIPKEYIVQGTVLRPDSSPLANVIVRVYAKKMRSENLLGQARTDRGGQYSITCAVSQQTTGLNLVVHIFDLHNRRIASSKTIFNARAEETVDMQAEEVAPPASAYEKITLKIKPLLAENQLLVKDLREDEEDDPGSSKFREISYVSGETGFAADHISLLVAAEKMGHSIQVAPSLLYGLFSKGLQADLYALGEQGKDKLRETLKQAVKEELISAAVQIDGELDKLFALPEITLLHRPLFLAKPQILFKPLNQQSGSMSGPEQQLIDAKLNQKFREMLINAAGTLSEAMSRALRTAVDRLAYQEHQASDPVTVLRNSVLPALKRNQQTADEAAALENKLNKAGQTVGELLHLDKPLQNNPLFFEHIRKAKHLNYARLAGMSEAAQQHLADTGLTPDEWSLAEMTKQKLITGEQAEKMLLNLDLAGLTGDNLPLMVHILRTEVTSTRGIIAWSRGEWLKKIHESGGFLPPEEESPESYTDNIMANIEQTYPSQTLLVRMTAPEQSRQPDRIDRLHSLLAHNERLIEGRRPAAIDWQGTAPGERLKLQGELRALTSFANTYRHLGFADLINDPNTTAAEKKTIMRGRLNHLDTFNKNNEQLDLRLVNFTQKTNEEINRQNIPEAERPLLRRQLMSFQRTLFLAPRTNDRQMLLMNGFDSSSAITRCSEAQFIKESGLAKEVAREIYANAVSMTLSVAHIAESLRETKFGLTDIGMAGNIAWKNIYNELREVDGIEDIFGEPQDYCECKECSSIFSPAAYFVDLMRFIDMNITSEIQKIKPMFANHALNLEKRRPDLWDDVRLTCENTHALIPYLVIVNEVLTSYLVQFPETKGDVFKKIDEEKNISFNFPFNLPLAELRLYLSHFDITLYEVYRLLDMPSETVYSTLLNLSANEAKIISTPGTLQEIEERYGASLSAMNSPDFLQAFLARVGIDRSQLDELRNLNFNQDLRNITVLKKWDDDHLQITGEYFSGLTLPRLDFMHRFIRLWKKTDWTIPELDMLLCSLRKKNLLDELVRPQRPKTVRQAGKLAVNFARRSERFKKSLEFTFIGASEQTKNDLHSNVIEHAARLTNLQRQLKLSVEELCALFDQLPASDIFPKKAGASQQRLMDVLFDLPALFEGKQETTYHHYSLNTADDQIRVNAKTPLLLAGLGISETELLLLFELLQKQMPFDTKGNTSLNRENISLLYRHARLAKAFKWSIEEFIIVLSLLFGRNASIGHLEQIYTLQEFQAWFKSSPLTVSDLAFLLLDAEIISRKFSATVEKTAAFVQEYQQTETAPFTQELLAEIKGVSLEDSRLLFEHMTNKNMLIAAADGYRINPAVYLMTDDFDIFAGAVISADAAGKKAIRVKLNECHPFAAVYARYANIDLATFSQAIRFSSADIGSPEFLNALQAKLNEDGLPVQPDAMKPVQNVLNTLEQVLLLFQKLRLEAEDMRLVADLPEAFGIDSLSQLNLEDIRALTNYCAVLSGNAEKKTVLSKLLHDYLNSRRSFLKSPEMNTERLKKMAFLSVSNDSAPFSVADLRTLIAHRSIVYDKDAAEENDVMNSLVRSYQNSNGLFFARDAAAALLGDVWQVDASLIESLARSLVLPPTAIEALTCLRKALDVCLKLGINGFSLRKLAADDSKYREVEEARDVALGAFSAKYEDEKVRHEKLEPYQDRINVLKRDALCDYILAREKDLRFKDKNDLYNFFLLDVEMSGCFRTSRLVCALSSLQLYVHRVFVNLEQSADGTIQVLKTLASVADKDGEKGGHLEQIRKEWEWRKNYRVWEANRKVFLYPENYLEPDLRDNKTPIFKELEEELLQEKITKESAEAAYVKYLTQFSELARLRIAGNYYHEATDTYYFFGRTTQDPPQYYYRMWKEQAEWTPWEKIELGINADYVSAIIHNSKLHLFWIDKKNTKINKIKNGDSNFIEEKFETNIHWSSLSEINKWIPEQKIIFEHIPSLLRDGDLEQYLKRDYLHAYERKCHNRIYLDTYKDIKNKPRVRFSFMPFPAEFAEGYLDDPKWKKNKSCWYDIDFFEKKYTPIGSCFYGDNILKKTETCNYKGNYIKLRVADNAGNYITSIADDSKFEFLKFEFTYSSFIVADGWRFESNDCLLSKNYTDVSLSNEEMFGKFNPDIDIVNNKQCDYVITICNRQYLTQWYNNIINYHNYYIEIERRNIILLTSSLSEPLGEKIINEGVETFISHETQEEIKEYPIEVSFNYPFINQDEESLNHIDFKGAYGLYYRELFFHIPFLIAHHLNANQKFEEAKWWYERIFDPTGSDMPDSENPNERNWRYLEFREQSIARLKDILTNEEQIKKYAEDPFSPHAIARLRLTAYQKTIVMKYIDNLLDWADSLFAQDTMESINEATMLYVLAADILGKRPVKLGPCETVPEKPLTYREIAEKMDKDDDEFLLTMENWNAVVPVKAAHDRLARHETGDSGSQPGRISARRYTMRPHSEIIAAVKKKQQFAAVAGKLKVAPRPPMMMKSPRQVFCVPPNYDLHKYWDRVEDRLFKIRHCMNISGIRRQLALFQPEIDPMMLVRAKAAGLSLDDILSMIGATVPPYRFSFLFDKAKQYTQTVQSFGSALLSALEKKDVEELTQLRSVHERNIMKLTKNIKEQQLAEAQYQYQAMLETKVNVQNRINYYDGLISEGLTGWEHVQQKSTHAATFLKIAEGILHIASGIYYLIPNAGSPFAMTYGGEQLGTSGAEFAQWTSSMAAVANQIAASAGLEASWDRREQEWKQQLTLAQQELKQVEQQCLAADIRRQIAEKDIEIHAKQMEQADELDNFYRNKFTNLGLYTYLSSNLNRLYRTAYNIAYDMARMAEKAYQFERDDDAFFIAGDNWQYDRAGLLAGERLLLQLQQMEKAYLEKNTRTLEITQSFSLALLDPIALKNLKSEEAACTFVIPEIAYDLAYPGQYKRIIKSVRLSIPCVAGPHINIGATLSLTKGEIRRETDKNLEEIPHQKGTYIATSSSMNDSGVFELNFRDERYLPFEGAGAISTWHLTLPNKIRQFDYNTISDVVVHVSYTALYDEKFKDTVEADVITKLTGGEPPLTRVFSLKYEFPDAFHRLLTAPESPQSTEIEIKQEHFPYFLSKFDLTTSGVTIFVRSKEDKQPDLSGFAFNEDNVAFENQGNDFQKSTVSISVTGNLPVTWTIASDKKGEDGEYEEEDKGGGLKREEIADILLAVQYKAAVK